MIGFQQSRSSARQQRRDRGAPYLSIVVACHNEAAGLRELYRRVAAVLDGLLKPGELVLVDDGSSDATWEAMRAICAIDGRVVAVSLSRNFGQQAAITAGLARARGERVLVLDADLQDPPELVFDMLDLMDTGADVVHAGDARGGTKPASNEPAPPRSIGCLNGCRKRRSHAIRANSGS